MNLYSVEDKIVKVLALAIGKRTDYFYDKVEQEIEKRRLELRQGDSFTKS